MKEPLTLEQLRAIQNRNLNKPDPMALLREVKRLRQIVTTCAHLLNRWGDTDDDTLQKIDWLQERLEIEPCVAEHEGERLLANRDEISQKRNAAPRSSAGSGDLLR